MPPNKPKLKTAEQMQNLYVTLKEKYTEKEARQIIMAYRAQELWTRSGEYLDHYSIAGYAGLSLQETYYIISYAVAMQRLAALEHVFYGEYPFIRRRDLHDFLEKMLRDQNMFLVMELFHFADGPYRAFRLVYVLGGHSYYLEQLFSPGKWHLRDALTKLVGEDGLEVLLYTVDRHRMHYFYLPGCRDYQRLFRETEWQRMVLTGKTK